MAMDLAAELNLLDPGSTRLYRDPFNDLVLEIAGGEPVVGIRVVRCFPLTAGDRFIALRDRDNSEVGIVEDLAALDDESSSSTLSRTPSPRSETTCWRPTCDSIAAMRASRSS